MTPAAPEWASLTAPELASAVERGAVALWAIGATEQHGPHLVTGFDHLTAEAIVRRAAAELAPAAVVLPTLPFGFSQYWLDLGGTLSLTGDTTRAVIVDVCRSLDRAGIRNLVIVNGHSGNAVPALAALGELGAATLVAELVSYWDLLERDRLTALQPVENGFGHAGELETSIALHLGDVVREERIPQGTRALDPGAPGGSAVRFQRAPRATVDAIDGVIGDAAAATSAVGELVVEMAVAALVAHCRELRGEAVAPADARPAAVVA